MNRRHMLQSGSAALAGSALIKAFGSADAETTAATTPSFIVRSGESRTGSAWTIGGVPHVWSKIAAPDAGGRLAVIEVTTPVGSGPPMHIHHEQNEWMYIMQGSFGLQCGSERVVLKAGDSFMAPMKIPHAYVVLGTEPAKHLNIYDPAGEIEAFFSNYDHDHGPNAPHLAADPANQGGKYHIQAVGPPLKAESFSA